MRFLTMVKAGEQQGPPPQAFLEAIGEFTQQAIEDGVVVDIGGLAPSAAGALVRLSGGRVKVVDGPFTEAKELVGGYAFLELGSKAEAVESARQLLELHRQHWPGWEGEIEVREVAGNTPPN